MLFVGYFEGITSQRGIAWRCSDSLSLRDFLGLALDESSPDHSSMTRIRQRLPLEVDYEVFRLVLTLAEEKGLLRGRTVDPEGAERLGLVSEVTAARVLARGVEIAEEIGLFEDLELAVHVLAGRVVFGFRRGDRAVDANGYHRALAGVQRDQLQPVSKQAAVLIDTVHCKLCYQFIKDYRIVVRADGAVFLKILLSG